MHDSELLAIESGLISAIFAAEIAQTAPNTAAFRVM
jgi:hypothetical protein